MTEIKILKYENNHHICFLFIESNNYGNFVSGEFGAACYTIYLNIIISAMMTEKKNIIIFGRELIRRFYKAN